MPSRSDAIKAFLSVRTHADIAGLYNLSMECQVNVAQDGGTRTDGEYVGRHWQGWTDGIQMWKSFRIPINANTEPTYDDKEMRFDLDAHAEGIGMTGWDWKQRCSRWVAFDFDAITGHSDKHAKRLTPEQIAEILKVAQDLSWITMRKSTGGKGLHMYVFLPEVPTQNHTEHAALARSILGQLSALTGFDFSSKVDVCGGNMWVWHRKMKDNPDGLKLIKQGTALQDVPVNWRDHILVVSGHRPKVKLQRPENTESTGDDLFDELAGQRPRVTLDDSHKKLLKFLIEDRKTSSWWDQDHHMLVTHTYYLREAHGILGMRGIFETNSAGKEAPTDINCFAFPIRHGGWVVRRYGQGIAESMSWQQDPDGWTRCYVNVDPDLPTAAKTHGALEHPQGGFVFKEAEVAMKAASTLGVRTQIPLNLANRETRLKQHKDGRLIIEIKKEDNDQIADWLPDKGYWKRVFNTQVATPPETESLNYDDVMRHLVTNSGDDAGWSLRRDNKWGNESLVHIKTALKSMGVNAKETDVVIGSSVMRCWTLVNKPFEPEYPGEREWNRDGAQFRFLPSPDRDNLSYPTWAKILKHCGGGLDEAVTASGWCQANGILSGSDYLKVWIASLFREPTEPLPYLFFYGPQDSGKSSFHESLSLLMTRGYHRVDQAITSQGGFNAELANAILCVTEEINLRKDKNASNRIKDWVTAKQLSIHEKGSTPYHITNTCHFAQTANDPTACPVFPGDTRITMIYVGPIDPLDMIPKKHLIPMLEKEAPDFLAAVLNLEIPPSNDRLNVPVITTIEKLEAEALNATPVERFLQEKCYYCPGHLEAFGDVYDRFIEFIDPADVPTWSKISFGKEMALHKKYPKGRNPKDGQFNFGNLSFVKPTDEQMKNKAYTARQGPANQIFLIQ